MGSRGGCQDQAVIGSGPSPDQNFRKTKLTSRDSQSAKSGWQRRGSRHQRGYGKAHEVIRAELLRTVILCEECTRQGRVTPGAIADHIVPLAKGGTGERSNYQLLCRRCASKKDAIDRGARRRPAIGSDGWPKEA